MDKSEPLFFKNRTKILDNETWKAIENRRRGHGKVPRSFFNAGEAVSMFFNV